MVFFHTDKKSIKENNIKRYLKKLFHLEIPGHTLKTIITRAKRTGYLSQQHYNIQLTEKGIKSEQYFELERDIEREKNHLIKKLQRHLKENGISINERKTSKILISVINSNLLSLTAYLGEKPKVDVYNNIEKKAKRCTLEFFDKVEHSNPSLFSTLKKMIMGSIICTLVKKDQNELKTKMTSTKIFLDTNIVFSILGYHHKKTSILAQELFNLLQKNNFEMYIFDFTLNEMCRVLSGYKKNYHLYNSKIKTDSMYNRLKNLKITKSDMTEILANLENKLSNEYSINIFNSDDLLKEFEINEALIYDLERYKNYSPRVSIKHDLKAIEAVKRIRVNKCSKLEKVNSIFLTSDQKLTKYNFEQDHKKDLTINEVIIDQMLTNVLWFKNPTENSNLPLFSVISSHSNSLFIDDKVWNKFSTVLKKMEKKEKITRSDITLMLFNDKFEDKLLDFEGDLKEINENFIEDLLEESKQMYNDREEVFKMQQEKSKSIRENHFEEIQRVKNNIKTDARIKSGIWYWGSIIFAGIILSSSAFWVWKQPWSNFVSWIIPIISLILSSVEIKFGLPFEKIKNKMYNFHLEKLNRKILGYDSLEDLEDKLEKLEVASTEEDLEL